MRLSDVLTEDNIIAELKAREKGAVLDEMVTGLAARMSGLDAAKTLEAVLDRERLGTTGIGHGVAVPHGKCKGIAGVKVFFGRSRNGVDFNSLDREPVYLVFLIIAPEGAPAAHLKALAGISHLLKSHDLRQSLLKAESVGEIYRIIAEADRRA
ncbi:MAG: PTS sugar transporter subunit IIA [Deltaproteobacteria bacterium]|nr:PTS sugar transporter subunit IIA [Deltaproteobacteria bacterium]